MFPKACDQISVFFFFNLISHQNWSCSSDKEQEAEFVHSLDVCLSFYTRVSSTSTQKICPHSLEVTHGTKSDFYLLSTKWRQPESWPPIHHKSVLDSSELETLGFLSLTSTVMMLHTHTHRSRKDKTGSRQETQTVMSACEAPVSGD